MKLIKIESPRFDRGYQAHGVTTGETYRRTYYVNPDHISHLEEWKGEHHLKGITGTEVHIAVGMGRKLVDARSMDEMAEVLRGVKA